MRANQILNGFSETLMQDERILSSNEKELLASLLQTAKAASGGKPEIQTEVTNAIHRAVGETVAHRAFGLLGSSIVEQILATSSLARTAETVIQRSLTLGPNPNPSPDPSPGPQPPSVKRPLSKDQPKAPQPLNGPLPGPHGLQSFNADARRDSDQGHADHPKGVEEESENIRARCVVLDEFLAPQELDELMRYTLDHESDFQVSEVISPSGDKDVIDYNHRRSRVLMDLGMHHDVIVKRISGVLPQVLERLGIEEFPVTWVETQITASNDGDFFHMHSDDGQDLIASRKLTFVYFFHGEPCQFKGGELRLHDSNLKEERHVSAGSYQTIAPQQNQIVFFPCSLPHEITAVECPSQAFADSRFTVNGWLRN